MKLGLIGLCESRLDEVFASIYKVPGMDMHSSHLSSLGGGVSILSNDFPKSIVIECLSMIQDCLENISITFVFNNKRFVVGRLYRPLNGNLSTFNSELTRILDVFE